MKIGIIIIAIVGLLSSCLRDKTIEPLEFVYTCSDSVSYANEIAPMIIDQSCSTAGCHSSTSNAGGYAFTNHSEVSLNSDIILKVLTHQNGFKPMPLGGSILEDSLIEKFYCWVEQGRLDN